MGVSKEVLHHLVDRLPDESTDVAGEFLLWLSEREGVRPNTKDVGVIWPGTSLYRLAGRIHEGPRDLAERHDYYLGQTDGKEEK